MCSIGNLLFDLNPKICLGQKRAHSKKSTFQIRHIPKRAHSKKSTFQIQHIPKRAHSKNSTFQKGQIPKTAHSKEGIVQRQHSERVYVQDKFQDSQQRVHSKKRTFQIGHISKREQFRDSIVKGCTSKTNFRIHDEEQIPNREKLIFCTRWLIQDNQA